MSNKLFYVLNSFNPTDDKHFIHIPYLLGELKALGWEVEIISEKGGRTSFIYESVLVSFLSKKTYVFRIFKLIYLCLILKKFDGSIVFVRISKFTSLFLGLFSKYGNYKVVYWVSGAVEDFNFEKSYLYGMRERILNKCIFYLVDKVVTGPESMLHYYKNLYGIKEDKLGLLYNDIRLHGEMSNSLSSVQPDVLRILMVHNFSKVRDTNFYFEPIVNALRDLSRDYAIILDVVGGGEELGQMSDFITDNFLTDLVRFYGPLPNKELKDFYLNSDIFIMPSKREGFPRVILEAMSYGLPIVSTDAGGVSDIFGEKQKFFMSSITSYEDFITNLIVLIKDRQIRDLLSRENIERVNKYSTQNVAKMYNSLLKSL